MKRLGQHFLINKTKLQKIVEALDLKPGDAVIEIGPGHGELTDELRNKNNELKLMTIERDNDLVELLKNKFARDKNLEVVHDDVLKILPDLCLKLHNSNFKIVGNIPFYITGYLLRILGELKNKPSLIVLTVQKEVAERICAEPPKMNLLAASVQFWAEPKIVDYIPKTDFQPQPKVDSAIIKLVVSNQPLATSENYYKLIKILFKQPRKTILNNLASGVKLQASNDRSKEEIIKILGELKINPADRPQNLSVEQIKKLARQLKT